jgi:hypothetical protein
VSALRVVSSLLSDAQVSLLLRASSRWPISRLGTESSNASDAAAKSFSVAVDLRWSISVDAAHVSESLSPLLLSLLPLSLLLLSQSLIRKELSIHAFAT